jgi:hypothetical protein
MDKDFINNLKLLKEDLFEYISMVDYGGDEEEFIFTFEGSDANNWEIEKFGKSEDRIFEWTDKEIQELINETLENNICSKDDKIFLDHLISFI